MITKEEYDTIKERFDQGIEPTQEELQEILEYTKAETIKTMKEQGIQLNCPHCGAALPLGEFICEHCGGSYF